jgi:hypothetical protein
VKSFYGYSPLKAAIMALGMCGFSSGPGHERSATDSIAVQYEARKEEAALVQENRFSEAVPAGS